MAQKQCASQHCDTMFEAAGARKFCDLHSPKKNGGTKKKPKAETACAESEADTVCTLDLTSEQMDRVWSLLPIEEKALGLLNALTAVRDK